MNPIERLTQAFEKFPGIGPRQAARFVHYLLSAAPSARIELVDTIQKLGSDTRQCALCMRWYVKNGTKGDRCNICGNSARDAGTLFVVEKDADIATVERSGFKGLYFVLGGTVPLAAEEPEKYIRAKKLIQRIEEDAAKKIMKEIILGLSATTEGDHTRLILQEKILPIAEAFKIKLSSLGRGLSTGSELEYADPDTIANALNSRN